MLLLRLSIAALATTAIACGAPSPPAIDPSGLADPTWREDEETDAAARAASFKLASPPAAKPAPPPAPAGPVIPRIPSSTASCPFRWVPRELGASVLRIPAAYAGKFMVPLFDAACACTRPGDHLTIVATVRTWPGSISAVTATRTEPMTNPDPAVDACLATVLGSVSFEGFDVGSDVVCVGQPEDPPKTGMGPPFFRFPRTAGCPRGPQSATIVYPLLIDRRGET